MLDAMLSKTIFPGVTYVLQFFLISFSMDPAPQACITSNTPTGFAKQHPSGPSPWHV
jgi:hypothetical protein